VLLSINTRATSKTSELEVSNGLRNVVLNRSNFTNLLLHSLEITLYIKKLKQSSLKSFMVTSSLNLLNNQSADCPILSNSCDNFMSTKLHALPNLNNPIKHFNNTSYLTIENSNKPINIYEISFYIN